MDIAPKTSPREPRKKNHGTTRTKKIKINAIILKKTTTKKEKCYKKKNSKKKSAKNVIEELIYDRLFIAKLPNQKYDSKTFIVDSGTTSHIVVLEENMTNICNAKILFPIGDIGTLAGTKHGNRHGYQERYVKLHCVELSDTGVILGLKTNLFIMTRSL